MFPDTDWKTTLSDQKCPSIDGSSEVEQMPAIQPSQPLSVTEIGIKVPVIGRGNYLKKKKMLKYSSILL